MKPLVSILIPAYNAEKWITQSIRSAVNQSWPHKEVIVIDDGSTDATYPIASTFESANLKVIPQDNAGASAARNHALSLAQGDFIQWLDADDILDPDKIAEQLKLAESARNPKILFSSAWGKFHHSHHDALFERDPLWVDLHPVEWLHRKIDQNLWMAIETWLVSRTLTDEAGPWNESLSLDDDGEYFSRILVRAEKILFAPQSKSYIRRGALSLSHSLTLNDQKLDSLAYSLESYVSALIKMEDSNRTRAACLRLLNRWIFYFYPERMDIYARLQNLAIKLGGAIEHPCLRKKYRWIANLFGWKAGKRAQLAFPALKTIALSKMTRHFNNRPH